MAIRTRGQEGSARLRRGRYSADGQVYLVTFTTIGRTRLFDHWALGSAAVRTLMRPELWRDSRLTCWVLMPDHWHGLLQLGASESLGTVVGRLKARTALAVNAERACDGSVWAEGFHDHALRSEEDVLACARYIVRNPVRAGLVRRVADYPFWDAIWIDGENRG
ncbi:MAG: transposase [Lysobacteraceae bacterium]|nr:MAG: transposase [Xanthomonadaceae bacterium]